MLVVSCGCETRSLTLKEHRLRISESGVPKSILGPKRDKIVRSWRGLHNEELRILCSSPNTIRMNKSMRMRKTGHVAHIRRGIYIYIYTHV
jgi:hypothetical protein